jgi:AraC family transcriptional regulator, exoenzyme S synthesis regulatory protein ExsA
MSPSIPDIIRGTEGTIAYGPSVIAQYRTETDERDGEFFITTSLFSIVLSGSKTTRTADWEATIHAGELIFLRSARYIMSQITPGAASPYRVLLLFLERDTIAAFIADNPELFASSNSNPEKPYHTARLSPAALATAESILPHFGDLTAVKSVALKTEALLHQIIATDNQGDLRRNLYAISRETDADLRSYMERNFCAPGGVAEFARATFRSISAFKKDFAATFKTTPMSWIVSRRLERARELIRTTDRPVTEVCFLCGFESLSHFIKIYRETYGDSPGRDRGLLRQK